MNKFSWKYALIFLAGVIIASWAVLTYVPVLFFQILFFALLGFSILLGLLLSFIFKKQAKQGSLQKTNAKHTTNQTNT